MKKVDLTKRPLFDPWVNPALGKQGKNSALSTI